MGCHPILLATHESVPSCSTRSIGWAARSSAGAAVTRSGSTSRWKIVPSLLTMRGGLPLARRSAATARPAHQVPPSRMQASGSSAVDAPSARRTSTASSSTDSFVQAPRRKHQSPRPLRFADLRSVRNRLVFQADSEAPPSIGRNKQSCDTPPPPPSDTTKRAREMAGHARPVPPGCPMWCTGSRRRGTSFRSTATRPS